MSTHKLTFAKVSELVALKHTLFGLPMTLLACFLALGEVSYTPFELFVKFFWIILAFTGARTAGMAINRLFDEAVDAKNERTAHRALPRGLISRRDVKIVVAASLLLFLGSIAVLNLKMLWVAPFIVVLLFFYSLAKRASASCHFILGIIEFFAPVLGWWAFVGEVAPPAYALGGAIFCWISGMDIIYALQDIHFDRTWGVYSLPAHFGRERVLLLAKGLHGMALLHFVLAGLLVYAAWPYWLSLVLVTFCFVQQHRHPDRPSSFFGYNAAISVTALAGALGSSLCKLLS